MFELGPIFRALLRQKVGAILIALQIAFTLAVIALVSEPIRLVIHSLWLILR